MSAPGATARSIAQQEEVAGDEASAKAQAAVSAALRTLALEVTGLEQIEAALRNGLGDAFAHAVELLNAARGRVIVTGLGKSGHIGRKIAATFADLKLLPRRLSIKDVVWTPPAKVAQQ